MGNINFTTLLFSFQGRINRGKFWLAVLVYFVANLIGSVFQYALGTLGLIVASVLSIAVFVSGLAVATKRLHDRAKSGWWLLLFYLAPAVLVAVGIFVGLAEPTNEAATEGGMFVIVLALAALAVMIWAFVELGCLRGTVGPNRYGPDPLQSRSDVQNA